MAIEGFGSGMAEHEISLCIEALWDNLMDGGIADRRYGSDFDKAEAELERTFRNFLAGRSLNE